MAVYYDGKLNAGRWYDYFGTPPAFPPLTNGQLSLIQNSGSQGIVALDELKVWNYAKTNFGLTPGLELVGRIASPTNFSIQWIEAMTGLKDAQYAAICHTE